MVRNRHTSRWPVLAGILVLLGAVGPATAEEDEESTGMIEEILVTAERRAQNLQETPIAITALSADTIEQTGMDQMEELQFVVPSLTYGMQSTYSLVAIRGVGSDVVTTAEPSIATYEDGVYTGLSFTHNVPGFDLERIEVLRGPQGTLYGRNAVGGVVNFISKPPSFEPEANVVATLGDLDTRGIDLGATGALLSDVVAGRISVRRHEMGDYRDNLVPGVPDFGGSEQDVVRGSLLIDASKDLTITLRGGYSSHYTTNAYQLVSSFPIPPFAIDTGEPLTSADPFGLTTLVDGPYGPLPLGIFSAPAQFFRDNPGLLSPADIDKLGGGSIADYYGLVSRPGPVPPDPTKSLKASSAIPTFWDVDQTSLSATVEWDLGGAVLRSITGWRDSEMFFQQDSTGASTAAVVFDPGGHETEQVSQEFNLLGTAMDDRLDWLVGFYYAQEDGLFHSTVWLPTVNDATLAGIATGNTAYDPSDPNSYPFQLIPPEAFPHSLFSLRLGPGDELKTLLREGDNYPPGTGRWNAGDIPEQAFLGFLIETDSTSRALFTQLTYHMTERARVTGGLRYTEDDKDAIRSYHFNLLGTLLQLGGVPTQFWLNPDGTPLLCDNEPQEASWDAWTGTIGLDYDLNEDTMLYVKYSEGYKGGSFNVGECGVGAYDPEYLDAFEGGIKSTFLDGQVRTNLAFYSYDFQDIQFTLYVPNQSFIRNAGQAETWGVELEYTISPAAMPGFSLQGHLSYQDSEYTEGVFRDPAGIIAAGADVSGNPLMRAPDVTFSTAAEYAFRAGTGDVILRLEASYKDDYNNDIFAGTAPLAAAATQPSYWMANARAIWQPNQRYEFQAFVHNVGDELYSVNRVIFATPAALENVGGQFTTPRTYGIRVRAHFGS